jgi:hypothetical protein
MPILQEKVLDVATSAGPAWVVNGSKTLLAWKGAGTDNGIYWSTTSALMPDSSSSQYDWTPRQKVPNIGTSTSPALASLKGVVYMAWKGEGTDTKIYVSSLGSDGAWTPRQVVPVGTSEGPALAVTSDTLYLAWKGESDSAIWWSKSSDGKTWSPQAQVPGVGTSAGPALASDGSGSMYLAWKGESDTSIWWSKCSDGKTWTPQQRGRGQTLSGPAMAVDGNRAKWLAWYGFWNNPMVIPAGIAPLPTPMLLFSRLIDESNNTWGSGVGRLGSETGNRPALLSTGVGDSGLMLAWSGPGTNNIFPIFYSPLLLPPQTVCFNIPDLAVRMMRTGHATLKDGTDTVYVSIAVKINSQKAITNTKYVGDLTGGEYGVGVGTGPFTIQDTDTVYFSYCAVNSSQGLSAATAFLENVGGKLLDALEMADSVVLQDLTGVSLSQLTSQEAGALVGAQLGSSIGALGGPVLMSLGVVIGALAGFFSQDIWGFAFPDCDGPVAAGLYTFSAPEIRAILLASQPANHPVYVQTDDNPGITSADGCGQNSYYQIIWNLQNP